MITRRNFCRLTAPALAGSLLPGPAAALMPARSLTGYQYNEIYLDHPYSPEVPERLIWINRFLRESGLNGDLYPLKAIDGPMSWIRAVHSAEHIAAIQDIEKTGDVAARVVAGICGAVKAVCSGTVRNAFCAVRPPGHHAHNGGYIEGYCCYANAVIAARYARAEMKIPRVLIIDWDYHHGNGTQDFVYRDPNIFFFSTHNAADYPGNNWECETGMKGQAFMNGFDSCTESRNDPQYADVPCDPVLRWGNLPCYRGMGKGHGTNLNVPMKCGEGNDAFRRVFEEKLVAAAESFKPGLIIISAGFDGKRDDTHGCFDLTARGFSRLTRIVMSIADTHCKGRIVSLLEGGYADYSQPGEFNGLASSVQAHIATLRSGTLQPEAPFYKGVAPVAVRSPQQRSPRIRNGYLLLPSRKSGAQAVRICSCDGRTVRTVRTTTRRGIHLGSLRLAAGAYFATVSYKAGRRRCIPFEISLK